MQGKNAAHEHRGSFANRASGRHKKRQAATMIDGCITALATPFRDQKIDFEALRMLVSEQVDAGVAGIVPTGTTGESPTLDFDEHKHVISNVIDAVGGRCKVVAGTGGNSTAEALELTTYAGEVGADASLQVTPYYNKPSQEGLYRHFSIIADTVDLPMVLYNVPGRTGIAIAIDTVARLARHTNIVAIKEAGGSVDRVSRIRDVCDLDILSGDDALTLPMVALGACGVISVASNIIPREIVALTAAAVHGDIDRARELHYTYYRLFTDLFIETNPVPIKTALAAMGKIREDTRPPLCPLAEENRKQLLDTMAACGLV